MNEVAVNDASSSSVAATCAQHGTCTAADVMVDAALRIRLEGRVEELERAIRSWGHALTAAKRNEFDAAAQMLNDRQVSLRDHGDDELASLLSWQLKLRRKVEAIVIKRLRFLGMPSIDLARGAKWLATERVLYEHDCLVPGFVVQLKLMFGFIAIAGFVVTRSWVALLFALLGTAYFSAFGRLFVRSRVVLTARRLILEGTVVDLTAARRILVVRTLPVSFPQVCDVEIHSKTGEIRYAKIRHASEELRHQLISLGLDTGNDWGPT